jgi:hypothetical protein
MVPLPDCASGEWGPTKATRLFGLIPITHQVNFCLPESIEHLLTFLLIPPTGTVDLRRSNLGHSVQNVAPANRLYGDAPQERNRGEKAVEVRAAQCHRRHRHVHHQVRQNFRIPPLENPLNFPPSFSSFPEEGQYGLDIYTREVGGSVHHSSNSEKHLLTHCCKYLINSSKKN